MIPEHERQAARLREAVRIVAEVIRAEADQPAYAIEAVRYDCDDVALEYAVEALTDLYYAAQQPDAERGIDTTRGLELGLERLADCDECDGRGQTVYGWTTASLYAPPEPIWTTCARCQGTGIDPDVIPDWDDTAPAEVNPFTDLTDHGPF